MGIIGNKSIYYKSPATFIGGGAIGQSTISVGQTTGSDRRARFISPDYSKLASTPMGSGSGVAWVLPVKGGALASINNTNIDIAATAQGWMGLPASGVAAIALTFADAAGGLIASGDGASGCAITTNNPLLTASISGTGSVTYAITGGTSLAGALASGSGSAAVTFAAFADILPLDDTPPARGAAASYSITGSLIPYAIGSMVGNALPYTELSPQSLAAAVLAAAQQAPINSNVKQVNNVTVIGTGQPGNEWGP